MTAADQVTIDPAIVTADGAACVTGMYDEIPVQVRLAPDLAEALRDGDRVAPEKLRALEDAVSTRIHQGTGTFGRRSSDGRGILVIALDALTPGR